MENVESIKNGIRYTKVSGIPEEDILKDLLYLNIKIFGAADKEKLLFRLKNNTNVLSVLAYKGVNLIGFKIGYEINKNTYYSWLGGVLSIHRKQGVATQLLHVQENWAKRHGFKTLQTKSMNRFKAMMIFNLKNGFNIIEVQNSKLNDTKILFEKVL